MDSTIDGQEELTSRERQHLRHRERKRATPMVVDNAGVKRIARALADRAKGGPAPADRPTRRR